MNKAQNLKACFDIIGALPFEQMALEPHLEEVVETILDSVTHITDTQKLTPVLRRFYGDPVMDEMLNKMYDRVANGEMQRMIMRMDVAIICADAFPEPAEKTPPAAPPTQTVQPGTHPLGVKKTKPKLRL